MNNYYFTADKWYGPYNGESGYKVFLLPSGDSLIPEFAGLVKEEGVDFRLFDSDKRFWCKCEHCGWEDSSEYASGGGQIADTGDFSDAECPVCCSSNLAGDATVLIPEQYTGVWAVELPKPTAVPVAEEFVKIEHLLNLLAQYGGTIESTGAMDEMNIKQARASGRLYVDENSLGYVWMPGNFKSGAFPETVEDVELFEKWFPLPVELPEKLKTLDWLYKKKAEECTHEPLIDTGVGYYHCPACNTGFPVAEEGKQTFSAEERPEIANASFKKEYGHIETSGEFRNIWVDGYCQALRDFNIGT